MTPQQQYWLATGRMLMAAEYPVSREIKMRIDRIHQGWTDSHRKLLKSELSDEDIYVMLMGRLVGQGRQ